MATRDEVFTDGYKLTTVRGQIAKVYLDLQSPATYTSIKYNSSRGEHHKFSTIYKDCHFNVGQ
ncbi:MAG: hypothetical protein ACI93R_003303 [Flavobacteriales bacterium]|jgi:hypothetical protein